MDKGSFLLNGFVLLFSQDCAHVYVRVCHFIVGVTERAAARLVRLQSGKLEEKTLCFSSQSMLQWKNSLFAVTDCLSKSSSMLMAMRR